MAKNDNITDLLIDVANAIREKKGTSDLINPQNFAEEIMSIETGESEGVNANDVTFYDYDGTILYSYTKEQFLLLSELPPLPIRDGLICQEWNYSIEYAKEYVSEYGKLDIGATYITDDGKTRFYINITTEGRMDFPLSFRQTVGNGVIVDWGDGSAFETFSGTSVSTTHHYNNIGEYIINFEVVSGALSFIGSTNYGIFGSREVYGNMLKRVEFGNNITSIGNSAFSDCYSLSSVVIPNNVTSIGNSAFTECYSISSVVIPNSVTSIGNSALKMCYSLYLVVIPNGIASIGSSVFEDCHSLTSIVIPNSVTSIWNYAFSSCHSLTSIVIPNNVTSIGNSAFTECYSISSVVIPNSVTSIEYYLFYGGHSLTSIVIPNSVTSIGNYAFSDCYSLSSVVIPNNVTSIGSSAFYKCKGVAFFDFRTYTSIPTLSNTDAFSSISSDCKIVVPNALYDEWLSATNWSSLASHIIKASEYNG